MVNFVTDKKFDGILMVQDHLRFEMRPSLRLLTEFDKPRGIDKGVGITFEAA